MCDIMTICFPQETAIAEVAQFAREHAATGKCRRNKVVNWAAFNQRHGVELSKANVETEMPFEERQWIIRQVGKFGRTEAEASAAWKVLAASDVERDHGGYKGQVRLWLPKGPMRVKERRTYANAECLEGSDTFKKPTAADIDALRLHCWDRDLSHGSEFFAGQSTLAAQEAAVAAAMGGGTSAAGTPRGGGGGAAGKQEPEHQTLLVVGEGPGPGHLGGQCCTCTTVALWGTRQGRQRQVALGHSWRVHGWQVPHT